MDWFKKTNRRKNYILFSERNRSLLRAICGGGSVFFSLLKKQANVKKFRLSDKNDSLIKILTLAKNKPQELVSSYRDKWEKLQKDSNFFYTERELYNKTKCPLIFYFLTRTCYNGTIRYNKKGEFNTSHHFGSTTTP